MWEYILFNISSLSKFYLNYEPSLKGPDVDKDQIFYFLRWKVQRKVCFIKPIETIVTRPKGPRDTTDLLYLPDIPYQSANSNDQTYSTDYLDLFTLNTNRHLEDMWEIKNHISTLMYL